jgi:hypothetical protein
MIMKRSNRILSILVIFVCAGVVAYSEEKNLIQNPSFEDVSEGKANLWSALSWNKDSGASVIGVDNNEAQAGKNSVFIENKKENHTYFSQGVAVEELSMYKFSAWIKTLNVGKGNKGGVIGVIDRFEITGDFRESNSAWNKAEMYIATGKNVKSVTLLLSLGWYGSVNTGKVWFDNTELVKTDGIPEGAVVCSLVQAPGNKDNETQIQQPQQPSKAKPEIIIFLILAVSILLAGAAYFILIALIKKNEKTVEQSPGQDAAGEGQK